MLPQFLCQLLQHRESLNQLLLQFSQLSPYQQLLNLTLLALTIIFLFKHLQLQRQRRNWEHLLQKNEHQENQLNLKRTASTDRMKKLRGILKKINPS